MSGQTQRDADETARRPIEIDLPVGNDADDGLHQMANAAGTKNLIETIPASAYRAFRRYLQSGDLLFSSRRPVFPGVFPGRSKAPWSRVGIIVRIEDGDRLMVLESRATVGVRLSPLSHYFGDSRTGARPDADFVAARHAEVDPQTPAAKALISYGMNLLGQRYSWAETGGIVLRCGLRFGSFADRRTAFTGPELVDACFAHRLGGGFRPFYRVNERYLSVTDIWADPRVMPIRRLLAQP